MTDLREDQLDPSALASIRARLLAEIGKSVVGQREALEGMFVALLAGGHVLLEGVPGTAKTLMVRAMARSLGLSFQRIQFTPDLMPSDVVGTSVFDFKTSAFTFTEGPIFTELLLADEINRAPAKTQSALLEAMQERQVSVDGERHALARDFTVFATQNPVEQEGTYPLPEAQLDRFLLKIRIDYPSSDEEDEILARASHGVGTLELEEIVPVVTRDELHAIRPIGARVAIEARVRGYVRDLCRATRSSPLLLLGAGPRAGVHLLVASRWIAALDGRTFVTPDDVKRALHPVICHRLVLAPEVELDGMSVEDVIDRVAASVEVPR